MAYPDVMFGVVNFKKNVTNTQLFTQRLSSEQLSPDQTVSHTHCALAAPSSRPATTASPRSSGKRASGCWVHRHGSFSPLIGDLGDLLSPT